LLLILCAYYFLSEAIDHLQEVSIEKSFILLDAVGGFVQSCGRLNGMGTRYLYFSFIDLKCPRRSECTAYILRTFTSAAGTIAMQLGISIKNYTSLAIPAL